jgi:hypothetical protein
MSSPNIVLSVWQLTLMAVVPVVLLLGWLIVVLFVGRETRVQDLAATGATPCPGADSQQSAAAEGALDKLGQPAGGRLAA